MSKYATAENAEAIRNCTDRARNHLRAAESELRDALMLARDDYDHNADRLAQIVGALGLVASSVSAEHSTWRDYAAARRQSVEA